MHLTFKTAKEIDTLQSYSKETNDLQFDLFFLCNMIASYTRGSPTKKKFLPKLKLIFEAF